MHYGIRLLMGLTLTWMIVVWPPIHQDLSFFGFPSQEIIAFSETETRREKTEGEHPSDSQKKEERQASPEAFKKSEECDPKDTLRWTLPIPF